MHSDSPDADYDANEMLGSTRWREGRLEEARDLCQKLVALRPDLYRGWMNLGFVERELGLLDSSIEHLRHAVALAPDESDAHTFLAFSLLTTGRYAEGFTELGWSTPPQNAPLWQGQDIAGRTLLVWTDQGFGDAIQYARYLPLISQQFGARVTLFCFAELADLFAGLPGVDRLVVRAAEVGPFDLQVAMTGLPLAFGTTIETIPPGAAYLRAGRNPDHQLDGHPGMKVGLVWRGSPTHRNDHNRSIAPELLDPLAGVEGVTWFSLQKDDAPRPWMVDLSPRLQSFTDTAEVMNGLDLVISVDTATAHLAGAMGRPLWLLLPWMPDWRWMLDREDSPWYPSARLFRQRLRGDWVDVIERVEKELGQRVRK